MATKPKTRYFSKTINGEDVTQIAHAPADAVRYVYDGWREVTEAVEQAAALAKQPPAPADKPAVKPR